MDKMAADMAIDLKDHNMAALSIWMGALLTDRLKMVIASDPKKSGHLEGCAEMAVRYGIRDANGQQPLSCRDTHKVAPHIQCPNIIR